MAAALVSDTLSREIARHLPPEPRTAKGGRPRVPDWSCLEGPVVRRAGISWERLPQRMGCGSGRTCWRRLRDGPEARVWARLRRGIEGGGRLGRYRRFIERTPRGSPRCRRRTVRYERPLDILHGCHMLAAALIRLRLVERWPG